MGIIASLGLVILIVALCLLIVPFMSWLNEFAPVVEVEKKPQAIKCPACSGTVSSFAEKCPHCGNPMRKDKKAEDIQKIREAVEKVEKQAQPKFGNCHYCGGRVAEIATMCPHCGAPLK